MAGPDPSAARRPLSTAEWLTRPLPFLLLILAPTAGLYAWGIGWGTELMWAYDEITPDHVVTSIRRGLHDGWPARYPPFHFWLLAPVARLYMRFASLDLLGPGDWRPGLLVVTRLVSVAMATASVAIVYRIAREAFDRSSALFAAIVAALPLTTVFYAKTVNLEVPYLFWFCLSLLGLFRLLRRQRLRDYALFTVAAALAVATKDQIYGFYLLAPLPIAVVWWRLHPALAPRHRLRALLTDRRPLVAVGAGLTAFGIAHGLPSEWPRFVHHVRSITGPSTASWQAYPATLAGQLDMLLAAGPNIAFALGFPFVLAAVAGMALVARDRRRREIVPLATATLLAAGYYAFFIGVVRFHIDRYFMPIVVVLALFAGRALGSFASSRRVPRALRVATIAIVVGWSVGRAAALDLMLANDSRYGLAAAIAAYPATERVLGVGTRHDLPAIRSFARRELGRLGPKLVGESDAEYVVINATHARHGRSRAARSQTYDDLLEGRLPYRPAFTYRWPAPIDPIGLDGRCFRRVLSNLCWINPELIVFERTDRPPGAPRLTRPAGARELADASLLRTSRD